MKHSVIPVGPLGTNCHLVLNEKKRELLIIDPGAEADLIISEAGKYDFDKARIILTHAHIDHIGAVGAVAGKFNIENAELGEGDFPIYQSRENEFFPYFRRADDLISCIGIQPVENCRILPLPGHTPGGRGLLFNDGGKEFLIAGDTIFYGSVGRTDLPGGDYGTLIASIRNEILVLDDQVEIFPGHGASTTVGFERANNPFLN